MNNKNKHNYCITSTNIVKHNYYYFYCHYYQHITVCPKINDYSNKLVSFQISTLITN